MTRIDPLRDKKVAAERAYKHALASGMHRTGEIFRNAAEQIIDHNNPDFFNAISRMNKVPVTIDEFVDSEEFLAGVDFAIWHTLRDDLRRMNPDVLAGETPIHEVLLGGATGTGKSHLSTASIAYQVYLSTCFDVPQKLFGLTPMTPMVFMLQSVNPTVTKRVLYEPFRAMFLNMPYVRKWCQWNERKESVLELSNNVHIIPAAASLQTILGQAVAGAILDEVNFMQIVENSKTVAGPQGLGGHFDQAEIIYSNISRRRKRSYTTRGMSIGNICTVSSTRYRMDFLDRKIDEMDTIAAVETRANRDYEPNHLSFRHKQYEVNPRFSDGNYDTFDILVGTDEYLTRVLEEGDERGIHFPDDGEILSIPMPYKPDFLKDPDAALRDVVGVATDAITPFFRRRNKITKAMQRGIDREVPMLTKQDEYELATDGMPEWELDMFPPQNVLDRPHFAHADLSKSGDKCGICLVRFEGMVLKELEGSEGNVYEKVPQLTVVAGIGIKPNAVHEIDIAEVRGFLLSLLQHGVNLKSVTFDGFASSETIQQVRKAGIHSEVISVDRTPVPYEDLRDMIYQDRLDIQGDCEGLRLELATVEWYQQRNKVDHPPRGTKDIADALAGAVQGALLSREIRNNMQVVRGGEGDSTSPLRRKKVRPRERERKQSIDRPQSRRRR